MISKTKICSRGHKYEGVGPCPVCWPGRLMKKYKDIDGYIDSFPDDIKPTLEKIRQIVRRIAPETVETISYGIPTFKLNGKNLVHFGGFKNHISFFPTSSGTEAFKKELAKFDTSKGTIRLPLDKPLPFHLIAKIVKYRVEEVAKQNEHSKRIT